MNTKSVIEEIKKKKLGIEMRAIVQIRVVLSKVNICLYKNRIIISHVYMVM